MEMQLVKSSDVRPEPLVEPPDGRLNLVDLFAQPQGAPFSAGVVEIWPDAPVNFEYDDDAAVCYMIEGSITLTENGEAIRFEPGDVVYIPQKQGLVVYWSTESYGKFFFVTYPHWR